MRLMRSPARPGAARCALGAVLGLAPLFTAAPGARAAVVGAFETYGKVWREIDLPPVGAGSFTLALDALPDGRLITATGLDIFVERSVGSGLFSRAASIDPTLVGGSTDPSFLRVSPDGARVALGAGFGKPVLVFGASALSTSAPATIDAAAAAVFSVNHDDAAWADSVNLAITAGTFGSPAVVTLLDTASDPLAPTNPVIINNIGGASAGIAFDAAGRLYTANGFDLGPGGTDTGVVKAFAPSAWSPTTPTPDFEATGAFVIDALSGRGLAFDAAGNFFVGGGDAFGGGETGFLAVVRAGAVQNALAGFGPVDPLAASDVRRLDPLGDGTGFFTSRFNPITGQLLAQTGDRLFATIPTPAAWSALTLAGVGATARRRRRHA